MHEIVHLLPFLDENRKAQLQAPNGQMGVRPVVIPNQRNMEENCLNTLMKTVKTALTLFCNEICCCCQVIERGNGNFAVEFFARRIDVL
ncbi:MAG: hypothetical protein V4487_06345, partial [Chlamydiota bacterium]